MFIFSKRHGLVELTIYAAVFLLVSIIDVYAQTPSHDPSSMIRNNDGRYWIFATGDGIWCMSSSDPDFSDWKPEVAPFADGYPNWIDDYVEGFDGFFWAPEIIRVNNTYHLYYSCYGTGPDAAIGLATASDLNGPWEDQGVVVYGENTIDPALLKDGDNLWLAWGNWKSGIDLVQLDPVTGLRLDANIYHLADGEAQSPALIKHGDNYYLFYQKGLCCNGVNSTSYVVVTRAQDITGPYSDERVFLPNKNGKYIGPGQVGYGEGKLTYHYYDGSDNGHAKLMLSTLAWRNGWPVATNDSEGNSGNNSGCGKVDLPISSGNEN